MGLSGTIFVGKKFPDSDNSGNLRPDFIIAGAVVHPKICFLSVKTCCNVAVIWYKLRKIDGGHRGHPSGNEVKPTDTRCVQERALGTRQRHSRSSCRNVEEIVCGRIELGYDR